jgi:ADP-ribosyl-[dinitrogen reductase] hydrolase
MADGTRSASTLSQRYRGSLLGLACGDAVGTAVEFRPRGSFELLTDMIGGGPFGLAPGQWTDDTSMAMCLAESLLAKGGFDAADQMGRYVNWSHWGYWSSTGHCFDIGVTVSQALTRFRVTGEPYAGSVDPRTAGNGSLMRLAPVVLLYNPDPIEVAARAADSSRTTHAAPEAVECCVLFALLLARALSGDAKSQWLRIDVPTLREPAVVALAGGAFAGKPKNDIVGSGYAVASLEAALWCFHRTDTFEQAVLEAANLGDDADTTAAIVGQLAGAYYGVERIPRRWLDLLHLRDEIDAIAEQLLAAATARTTN